MQKEIFEWRRFYVDKVENNKKVKILILKTIIRYFDNMLSKVV